MKKIFIIIIILFFTIFNGKIQSTGTFQQSGSLVIIVSKNNPVNQLTVQEVKNYYLRKSKSRWPQNNSLIFPIDYKENTALRKKFLKDVLHMTGEEFSTYFYQQKISNGDRPPIEVNDITQVISGIEKFEGGIGYAFRSEITDINKVKIVCEIF
ncbi:MAG: hypothetical protein HC906_09295 [Bacteroidales bacterium]|nr:hypothetical protein [Bacteroidales bacterium]